MGRYGYSYYATSFFLVSLCLCYYCPVVLSKLSQNQTDAMNTLSKSLSGNGSNVPWGVSNPCNWKGVTCDTSNSSIIKIVFSGYSLPSSSSQFLPYFCRIDTLQYLDLSNNQLGSIPDEFITECGKIKGLKELNFSKNALSGDLPTFLGFDGVESLDMSYNFFQGRIDKQLAGLVSLKLLNLSYNGFSGSLPTGLKNFTSLEHLVLSINHFEGTIPDEILSCKYLTSLDLRQNKLSGSIPQNIGNLSKLETLVLSSNNLGGEIPRTLLNITSLTRFAANSNQFIGSVPSGITKTLQSLDLSYNNLSGPIPEDLLSQSNLTVVDLSYNSLSGELPVNISPSMIRLRLGNNKLNGTLPSTAFKTLDKLMYLELESNSLIGPIPAEVGYCRNLSLLSLAQNQLSEGLPAELGSLHNLQVLLLQMNKFSGPIPISISQLRRLSTLNLSWNSLIGTIPQAMFNLGNLNKLYLQRNNFSGSIDSSISSLTSLIELQLGDNKLSGVIPEMPTSLQIALNLSSNLFDGHIPDTLGDLNNLEVLDLSNNKFSGQVPDSLIKMQALTELILSNNQLYGVIPNFGPHVKVDSDGNKDLKNSTGSSMILPRSSKKGASVVVAVLVAIAAAVFLVGLVTLLVVLISRRIYRVNDEQLQQQEDLQLPQIVQGNLLTPNGIHRSNIDFSKAMEAVAETSNVKLKTRFSTYYKAIMPSGSIYFVKKLNWSDKLFPLGSHDKFGKELEVLAKLNNSNVMTPLAYVLSTDSAYILYEFVSNGSLYDALHGSVGSDLDWASRYSIAVGVAQGLSFLHGFASSPILLLDLSSKSIMLKSFKEPLVGDIELYKVIDPSKSTGSFSAVAGSVGYIPPG